jgi:YD repeat-containing protein
VTDPLGHQTVYAYSTAANATFGNLLSMTTASGTADAATTQYQYDAATGYQTATIDPLGNETDYVRDALGNVLQVIQPSPDGVAARPTTTYTYDSNGKVLTSTDALGNVTSYVNCPFGLVVFQETDPDPATGLDDAGSPVTHYNYNVAVELTSVVDPLGRETSYAYLCPCQLAGAGFSGGVGFDTAFCLFGTSGKRLAGGAGGGNEHPCSPARCGRNGKTPRPSNSRIWQDAPRTCLTLSA